MPRRQLLDLEKLETIARSGGEIKVLEDRQQLSEGKQQLFEGKQPQSEARQQLSVENQQLSEGKQLTERKQETKQQKELIEDCAAVEEMTHCGQPSAVHHPVSLHTVHSNPSKIRLQQRKEQAAIAPHGKASVLLL